jgi:hypothetical protein
MLWKALWISAKVLRALAEKTGQTRFARVPKARLRGRCFGHGKHAVRQSRAARVTD